jgi:alpha-tubulin suppressor-like RCC1 family protein
VNNEVELWAAGNNGNGQLGTGDLQDKNEFTLVNTQGTALYNEQIIQVATGAYHSCVLTRHGEMWVCGLNDDGQLGLSSVESHGSFVPVALNRFLQPEDHIRQIVSGCFHTCILAHSGL